ncbi:hypothetical protein DY000_02016884 [Brassica cretica]|uniref:FAR1 domain-containing protein n=1 Tax=Brassica cretica TaxID=69181 RepID=A0ABQ7CUE4_BRACR|nr:hypothetical protein DY000_02016884 [Brassica cretica]
MPDLHLRFECQLSEQCMLEFVMSKKYEEEFTIVRSKDKVKQLIKASTLLWQFTNLSSTDKTTCRSKLHHKDKSFNYIITCFLINKRSKPSCLSPPSCRHASKDSYELVGSNTNSTSRHISQHHHRLANTQANNLLGTHDLNTRLRVNNNSAFRSEEEDDVSLGESDVSLSEFEEEYEIATKEVQRETEDADALEANNENEKKDELCIGMEFSSDETAYIAYSKYASNHGFNVRKQRRAKKRKEDGKVARFLYVCSKEGVRKELKVKRSYTRPITRRGCKAHMDCYLQTSGRYKIVSFEPNHNHDLVRTPMKHLLKGNRAVTVSQKQHADDAELSGISAKSTVEMMSLEHAEEVYTPEVFTLFQKEYTVIEDKLVEEEEEEGDEDIPNVRGIKRKNPCGRPKNQKFGSHGRFKGVLEKKNCGTSKSSSKARAKKKLSFQESTCTPDTQPSFATTGPFLYNESFFSQISQEPILTPSTQLSVAATNSTLHSGSFFSQLLEDFDKSYGDGSSKDIDKNYGDGSSKDIDKNCSDDS